MWKETQELLVNSAIFVREYAIAITILSVLAIGGLGGTSVVNFILNIDKEVKAKRMQKSTRAANKADKTLRNRWGSR